MTFEECYNEYDSNNNTIGRRSGTERPKNGHQRRRVVRHTEFKAAVSDFNCSG
jgi:hypothetical protein